MKVHSYTILHYGKDYLPYALRSVYDCVDQMHIIYTPNPSHGHRTDVIVPESKNELMTAAFDYDPDEKIIWYDVNFRDEGKHRDFAKEACRVAGADLILVLDCDEIWHYDILQTALHHVWIHDNARDWLINFIHFWRSFDWVCRDNNWPVRIIDLRYTDNIGYVPKEFGDIYHFGYATTDKIMRYKWQIHGHKNELRADWWNKWDAGISATDCHPTNSDGWWQPMMFYKQALPELMKSHPFYDLELIE